MEAKDVKNLMEAYASLYTEPEVYGNLEEAYQEPKFGKKQYIKKLSKRGGMGMGTPEDPHGYRDPKMAKVGAELSKRKTAAARAKKTGEPNFYKAEKESQSKYQKEEFETWVNALVEEGYDLSEYTWDDMYEIYLEEVEQLDENRMASHTAGMSDGARASAGTQVGSRVADSMDRSNAKFFFGRRKKGGQAGYSPNPSSPATKNRTGRGQPVQYRRGKLEMPKGRNSFKDFSSAHKEEVDLFDYILEHLVAEGYADTNENALVIMANMSEEWKQSIIEEKKPIPNVAVRKQMKKKLKSDKMGDWEDVGRMSGHTGVPVPKH